MDAQEYLDFAYDHMQGWNQCRQNWDYILRRWNEEYDRAMSEYEATGDPCCLDKANDYAAKISGCFSGLDEADDQLDHWELESGYA